MNFEPASAFDRNGKKLRDFIAGIEAEFPSLRAAGKDGAR